MPMDRRLYPSNWDEIATGIKVEINWCCESCGRPCLQPRETDEDFIKRIQTTDDLTHCPVVKDFKAYPRRYLLTVAHLNHIPSDCDRSNLRAWCNPCHCRYDLSQMYRKRQLKLERNGQLRIQGV